MGQYYYVINLDKKEYLHPHKFGDGLKLWEFGSSGTGTMFALAVLLSDGNGRGGGDVHSDSPLVGSWARDRIIISGDYADGEWSEKGDNLYDFCGDGFLKDISEDVIMALCEDSYYRKSFVETALRSFGSCYRDGFGLEFAKKFERAVVYSWPIASFSQSGETYRVDFRADKSWTCSCPAFKFHPEKDCKHITEIKSRERV